MNKTGALEYVFYLKYAVSTHQKKKERKPWPQCCQILQFFKRSKNYWLFNNVTSGVL